MKPFLRNNRFLLMIFIIAAFFRLYQLHQVPPSGSLDEVSIGWNAYSILKTGRDEYGGFPILLRAYDDFRPAMHVYLTIPFVALFGLAVEAVRLPVALLSILTVLATYFLILELSKNKKLALLTSFLLSISPWHIYISRLGHEVNEGLVFAVFALLFFLKKRIYFTAIFFALSLMSYHPEKVFIPVLLFGMVFIYKKEICAMKRKIVVAGIMVLILLAPFIKETLSPQGLTRLSGTNVFNSQSERFHAQAIKLADAKKKNDLAGQLFHNRRILYGQIFLEGYLSHFNPQWLFTNTSSDRHKVPSIGLFYLWEAPFIILGIIALFVTHVDVKIKKLVVLWIIASPLAAAIATDTPHAMRSFTMLPMPQVLSSLGLLWFVEILSKYTKAYSLYISRGIFLILIAISALSMMHLYKNYFIVFPKEQSSSFQYALAKAIPFVLQNQNQYEKIIFSNSDNLYQSYMLFLFYTRYDPVLYQKQGGTKSGGFAENHSFGKYEFRPIEWDKEKRGTTLYVGNIADFPENVGPRVTMKHLNGEGAIKIVE